MQNLPIPEDSADNIEVEITLENYEDYLKDNIIPQLENGRPNWDAPHTEAVVLHIKNILESYPQVDPIILIISAYCHDLGYSGLFNKGEPIAEYDVIKEQKALHMEIGADKTSELLKKFTFLSNHQKERIVHLVRVHDKVSELTEIDELLLMEADTLGALDINVPITFNKENYLRYQEETKRKRVSRFITEYSKAWAQEFMKLRTDYVNSLPDEN